MSGWLQVEGSGPAVLLVQGGASRGQGYWLDVPEEIAEFATVISLDRPGTGTNPHTGARLSLATQASQLADVLRELNVSDVVVVGHSLGGPVAGQLGLDFPDLVSGLVLLDPTPITTRTIKIGLPGLIAVLARLQRLGIKMDSSIEKKLKSQLEDREWTPQLKVVADLMVSDDQLYQLADLLQKFDADATLLAERLASSKPNLKGLIATADRKPGSLVAKAHQQMADLLGLPLEIWPGTTHVLQLQQPDRVVETVRRVLLN